MPRVGRGAVFVTSERLTAGSDSWKILKRSRCSTMKMADGAQIARRNRPGTKAKVGASYLNLWKCFTVSMFCRTSRDGQTNLSTKWTVL